MKEYSAKAKETVCLAFDLGAGNKGVHVGCNNRESKSQFSCSRRQIVSKVAELPWRGRAWRRDVASMSPRRKAVPQSEDDVIINGCYEKE